MPTPKADTLAARLALARRHAGFATREAGARACGVKSGRYWLHEQGTCEPRLDFIRIYAVTFNVDPGWLAFGSRRR